MKLHADWREVGDDFWIRYTMKQFMKLKIIKRDEKTMKTYAIIGAGKRCISVFSIWNAAVLRTDPGA
jgi:hypothetical protein